MSTEKSISGKAIIRPMEARDIDAVYEIQRRLVGEERALIDTDLIAENLGGALDLSFVADTGSEVVGFIIARHTFIGEPADEAGLIQGLGVDPLHQRQGLATRLLNTLIDTCRSKKIKTLRAMLGEQDSQFEGFFKRMKFYRAKLIIYDMSLWGPGEVENKQDKWVCAHCGYTSSGRFIGDICPQCGLTWWKCAKCGFLITAAVPPNVCPECGEKCDFVNVTCYTPECGGPSHFDPRLV